MLVIIGYFQVIVDWGFSWRGTSRMAVLRNDPAQLSREFVAGWTLQVALALASIVALTLMCFTIEALDPFRPFLIYGCVMIASAAVFPQWLPFGLERVREVALMQFSIRVGSVPLIFIFVRDADDGPLVLASMAATQLTAGLIGLRWMLRTFTILWGWPTWQEIREEFRAGGAVFVSRIWVMLYTTLIPTALGALTNMTTVGFYMLADRLRTGIVALITPLVQALLPRMSFLIHHDKANATRLLVRSIIALGAISGSISLATLVLAEPIILLVGGPEYAESVPVLRYFALVPLLATLSSLLGLQILIPSGRTMMYNRALLGAGLAGGLMMVPLINQFGAQGAALTMLIGETIAAISIAFYVWRSLDTIMARVDTPR